jgi:hypothetical protein
MRIAAFLLIAAIAAPATAQDAIPLKWSLKEGDKFFVKDDTLMNMEIVVMGMTQDGKVSAITNQRFRVISVKQNSTTVELTNLRMDIQSEGAANSPIYGTISQRINNTTVSAVLDENMSVTKLLDYDKFIDQLAKDDEKLRKQMQQQFSETNVSEMFSQVFSFSPKMPVKIGDTWPRSEKTSFGGIDAVAKMNFKLDSVAGDLAKFGYSGELKFKADAKIPGLPEGFEVDKIELKTDKFSGTMKFDTKIGRLSESTQDANVNGTLTLDVAGQKLDMTVKFKVKQKLTVGDKSPIKD